MPIDASDLTEFSQAIRNAGDQMAADFPAIDQEVAALIVQASLPSVPRRTGALASGHTVVAGVIRNQRRYALPVFAGWRRGATVVAGRPWLRTGEASTHDQAVALYTDGIENALGKV